MFIDDTWENTPRLYDLSQHDLFRRRSESKWEDDYFHDSRFRDAFSSLKWIEKYLQAVPDAQWKTFCDKVIQHVNERGAQYGWRSFMDSLAEAKGVFLLVSLECRGIELIAEGAGKSPDWRGYSPDGQVVLVEVKRLNQSDIEVGFWEFVRRKTGQVSRKPRPSEELPEGFKRKALCTIKKAQRQLQSVSEHNSRKICLLDINFDDGPTTWCRYLQQFEEFISTKRFPDIDIEVVLCHGDIWFTPMWSKKATRLHGSEL